MSRFPRNLFELRNAEAVDISDPDSFGVRQRGLELQEGRESKGFSTSRSNGCCIDCREVRRNCAAESRRKRPRSARRKTLLENDLHGFRWISSKNDGYQSLNVSGKSVKTKPDVYPDSGIRLRREDELFFPDISFASPFLVTGQTGLPKRQRRRKRLDSLETSHEEEEHQVFKQTEWIKEKKETDKDPRKKIFINVILPKIT